MPFCSNCGAPVDGRFCAKCGRPLAGAASPALGSGGRAGLTDNVASTLCYVAGLITGVLFLILEPYNRNPLVRFHAFQSIFLFVAWIVVILALNILFVSIRIFFLTPVVQLALFALWIYMIVVTYQGRKVILPVIGPLAEQQAARP